MTIDVKSTAELLKKQDNILILSHQSPDGDTLGSGFALFLPLKALGKSVRHECNDEIPKKFHFLSDNIHSDIFQSPSFNVAVDVADCALLGEETAQKYGKNVDLCIDHHMSHREFSKYLLLEDRAAACEIVLEVIKNLCNEFTKEIATCLYTGISTDTGCFRCSNANANTHLCAAFLIEKGAESAKINQ